jgi:hypothetical protein
MAEKKLNRTAQLAKDLPQKLAAERIAAIEAISGERYPRVAERKAKAMQEAAERLDQMSAMEALQPFNGFSIPAPHYGGEPRSAVPHNPYGEARNSIVSTANSRFWSKVRGNDWRESGGYRVRPDGAFDIAYGKPDLPPRVGKRLVFFRSLADCLEFVR